MLKRALPLLLVVFTLVWACKPQDETVDPNPSKALRFSQDTIFFDTVFTEQRLITQRLKIYNDNDKAILVEEISMLAGAQSPYTFYVNGRPGPVVRNLEILGKDSAYVLISGKLNAGRVDTPLVIEDKIQFRTQGRGEVQQAPVLAKGQDAIYLNAELINKDTTFRADKPIVVFNSLLVDSSYTLTVEPGTRIHMYNESYFIVKGTLRVMGTYQKPVRFTGTRLEPYYKLVPGQWGYIALTGPSTGNEIHHAIIENGIRGIQLNIPEDPRVVDLILDNTLIRNIGDVGLWAFGAFVSGVNVVLADCGSSYILGQRGGSYNFAHCTIAQSGNNSFNRKNPAVAFTDFYEFADKSIIKSATPPTVEFFNSVVSGSLTNEFVFSVLDAATTKIDTQNVRNNVFSGRRGLNMARQNRYTVLGTINSFAAPYNYDFRPDSTSPGILNNSRAELPSTISARPNFNFFPTDVFYKDFIGESRDANTPYPGAYEKKIPKP